MIHTCAVARCDGTELGHDLAVEFPEETQRIDEALDGLRPSIITVTIPKPLWLTSNRHAINRGHRAAIVRAVHKLAEIAATDAHLTPISGPVAAHWTIRYPKGVRRDKGDASNAQPTCKALLDGLVPTWLPDDGPLWVTSETYRRGLNLERASDHEISLLLIDQEVTF